MSEAARVDGRRTGDDGFVRVAAVTDVPPGWSMTVKVGPRAVALSNCDGDFFAIDDACSHAGGPLGDNRLRDGCLLVCPWHGSVVDAREGRVARGPARTPQRVHAVAVRDGDVYVALDPPPERRS